MAFKEDFRVKRTKKALVIAFMRLLEEKPLDKITVNELCKTAGIRRATFYKHYSDKFDFLTTYTHFLRHRFDRVIWKSDVSTPNADYYVAYAKRLIGFISENSTAVDNIFNSPLFHTVFAIIVEQNYKDTCERLRTSVACGLQLCSSVEVVAAMCAGGVASVIYSWLRGGKREDPNVLAEQVEAVVTAIISPKS